MARQQLPRLEGEARERVGCRYAARLRDEGRLPAVMYGHGQEALHLSLEARPFTEALHGGAHLIEVTAGSKTEACLIKDVQWDHLGRSILHADLTRVDLSEEVEVEVEIVLTGEPAALKEAGAVLNHQETTIEVRCRADHIPDQITVDISELTIGESLTVADLALPEGVTAVTDPETVLARITIVEEEPEEETEAPEATGEEPEVIGRGKEEEEGEAKEK